MCLLKFPCDVSFLPLGTQNPCKVVKGHANRAMSEVAGSLVVMGLFCKWQHRVGHNGAWPAIHLIKQLSMLSAADRKMGKLLSFGRWGWGAALADPSSKPGKLSKVCFFRIKDLFLGVHTTFVMKGTAISIFH